MFIPAGDEVIKLCIAREEYDDTVRNGLADIDESMAELGYLGWGKLGFIL